MLERVPKYTLRKLSVGLASVMIGSGILMNSPKVLADTTNSNEGTNTVVQEDKNKTSGATQDQNTDSKAAVQKSSDNSFVEPATTTNAEKKVVADTKQDKDKQTNANKTTQNTTNIDKKDTEVTLTTPDTQKTTAKFKVLAARPVMKVAGTAETPDPTTPSDSTSMAIVNDKNKLDKNWIQLDHGKGQIYFTVKGNDQKTYVTSYMDKDVKSTLYTKRFDPNSLELHIEYQNGDKDAGPGLVLVWDDKYLQLNTSRIGAEDLVYTTNSGVKDYVPVSPGNGFYKSYNEWLKEKQDPSKLHLISLWQKVPANSTFTATLPFKYVGNADVVKSTRVDAYLKPYSTTLTFDPFELHPEQIAPAPKPTTDDATTTTGVYNNPDATSSDWLKLANGKAIAYYTAKGKDGKTYVTGYVGEDGKSQSIFNVDQIDPNSLEYHFIYHQDNNANNYGVWFNFADGKTIEVDGSRIKSDSLKLKSKDGYSYNWSMSGVGDKGIYYNGYADYLKNHNNSLEKATQISLTGAKVKAGDTIEMTIPVKYVGKLSDTQQSLDFSLHVDEYFDNGRRLIPHHSTLYFTTVRQDVSKIKNIVLVPSEFVSEQPGHSRWEILKDILPDMPNGFDAIKITNFHTFKGSFNMDSLPKGSLPKVIYGTAQYYVDLAKIQQIFADHGYTVKYLINNGKAQEMPFYAYVTLPLATYVNDSGTKPDPSTWYIQVQAVPALILNKDQHYVADPNAKPWDTTSMIDEIYAADDAGDRKTRDQLEKLPKTDVDISYEYQAPGAATATAVDKVDLTKAGVYTVTYSHTYADGRVVKDSRKVYVDGVKTETKDITRTIIVHTPNGTDQKVIQTATVTRKVILDATTGEIKSAGKWSTAKWEKYSAPEFKGYTPAPAQIDETTVNEDTQDTTVEISYTANETPEQPDHNVDDVKQETKDITRTIIVHTPNGTDQKVIQTATVTRKVILDATTGEIKSAGKWSTAKWEKYSAPEFKGYTPAPAQIDETTVNEDTQDTTVEISYKANKTPEQPDHSKDKDQGQNPQTPDSNENGKHHLSTGENTESSGSTTKTKAPVTANKVTKNLPQTGENTESSGSTTKTKVLATANKVTKNLPQTGENTESSGSTTKTKAPATANKVTKNLPQTGEKENQLGLLGIVLASLGVFGLGWKKREHE